MNWQLALVASLALVAAPMASAATLTVDVENAIVEPGGSYAIPFTYADTCAAAAGPVLAEILAGTGTLDVGITASGASEGVTLGAATASLDYTGCVTGPLADPSFSGTLLASADAWAAGMVESTVTLSDGAETDSLGLTVNYTNSYDVSVDATFPMETNDGMGSFNMTLTVTANAPSMMMFFVDDAACGTVTGIPEFLNINDGEFVSGVPTTLVREITYENTCSDNDMDYFEFRTVAHNPVFSTDLFQTHTQNWTFQNGAAGASGEGSNETPGVGMLVTFGALAAIVIARRKSL